MPVEPIPEGAQTLTPYLVIDGAASAIDFYRRAFGAEERFRMEMPDGKVGHASMTIGASQFMLADDFPGSPYQPPARAGTTGVGLYVYVEDVDAVFQRAVDAGASVQSPVEDMFWGDRWCRLADPFGHMWELATHVEDVSADDMMERAKTAMAGTT
jgi:PhnB protein